MAQVQTINGSVGQSPVYLGGPAYEWNVSEAPLTDGSAVGAGTFGIMSISPTSGAPGLVAGDFNWSGSLLDGWDNPPPAGDTSAGGQAEGHFLAGGTLQLVGDLYDGPGPTFPLVADDAVLFEGTIGDFLLRESNTNLNRINLVGQAIVTPTGGYLYDQSLTAPAYELTFYAIDNQQNGGDLEDFEQSILMQDAMQFSLRAIPEPASLMLLAGGLGLMLVRRRK
jgi:hypothetical protein